MTYWDLTGNCTAVWSWHEMMRRLTVETHLWICPLVFGVLLPCVLIYGGCKELGFSYYASLNYALCLADVMSELKGYSCSRYKLIAAVSHCLFDGVPCYFNVERTFLAIVALFISLCLVWRAYSGCRCRMRSEWGWSCWYCNRKVVWLKGWSWGLNLNICSLWGELVSIKLRVLPWQCVGSLTSWMKLSTVHCIRLLKRCCCTYCWPVDIRAVKIPYENSVTFCV